MLKKVKTEERYMFGGSFIMPTHFDFRVLFEYKNILTYFFGMRNNYNR